MSAISSSQLGQHATTARFRSVVEAKDIPGVLDTLAPNVVLRSPITDQVTFVGKEEIGELLRSVFATIDDIHYFVDVGDDHTRALFYRATVNGQPLEEATRVELDDAEQIRELTLFFRPLPGLATLAGALAPRIARKHGPLRSIIAAVMLAPLGLVTRLGDRLAGWFT